MYKSKRGFTLVEIILVLGLFALFALFSSVNILKTQSRSLIQTTNQSLAADIKGQQIRAMVGDSQGQTSSGDWGVHLEPGQYVLFRGSSYVASDPGNFVVTVQSPLSLSWTFPSEDIVFSKTSGEISGFTSGSDTITVTNASSSESNTITINRYGSLVRN